MQSTSALDPTPTLVSSSRPGPTERVRAVLDLQEQLARAENEEQVAAQALHAMEALEATLRTADARYRDLVERVFENPAQALARMGEYVAERGVPHALRTLEVHPARFGPLRTIERTRFGMLTFLSDGAARIYAHAAAAQARLVWMGEAAGLRAEADAARSAHAAAARRLHAVRWALRGLSAA